MPEHLFIQGRTASLAVGGGSSEAAAEGSGCEGPRGPDKGMLPANRAGDRIWIIGDR